MTQAMHQILVIEDEPGIRAVLRVLLEAENYRVIEAGNAARGEIEYVFGTLDSSPKVPWDATDRKLSDLMMTYWTNFARSGDPNGPTVPAWPRYDRAGDDPVLHLDTEIRSGPDANRARYELLDALSAKAGPR